MAVANLLGRTEEKMKGSQRGEEELALVQLRE
jgi:hypothetical protein